MLDTWSLYRREIYHGAGMITLYGSSLFIRLAILLLRCFLEYGDSHMKFVLRNVAKFDK